MSSLKIYEWILHDRYEKETGEKPTYRKDSSDYHTLRYVKWLEDLLAHQHSEAQPKDSADGDMVVCPECGCKHQPGGNTLCHH